ncbi:hypothetical protein [Phaeodactylibacter luteus]|uniref:Outer membrane protein beta-barrel domain-containing protein n=1 Tax=Phaeodactylibacter luteus TaxID=1564516 RepID=A0A5C6S5P8_9BACT|nr:hypothetical protein [Phaeodactylibacter luteus]TXB70148.1 hypothetical protein FRY97_00140 [Phaeodactylibacter luteus]
MKQSFFFVFFSVLLLSSAQAQETQTLFNSNNASGKIQVYLTPGWQYTTAAGQGVHNVQLGAGALFNEKLAIGGVFSASLNEFTPDAEPTDNLYLDLRYGGVQAIYYHKPGNLLHFAFPLSLGGGEMQADFKGGSDADSPFGESYFFFAEAGAQAELNLSSRIKAYTGLTYRFAAGEDYTYLSTNLSPVNISAQDISGLGLQLGLRFVLF